MLGFQDIGVQDIRVQGHRVQDIRVQNVLRDHKERPQVDPDRLFRNFGLGFRV